MRLFITFNTETGCVRPVDKWGHGRAQAQNWEKEKDIIVSSDYGSYTAWRYTGRFMDAARVIAGFLPQKNRTTLVSPPDRLVISVRARDDASAA